MSRAVGYRGLRAWESGIQLTEAVYELADRLPADERFGLASQMKRAAASVPMNLAEGYGRGGREFARFIGIAYGSLLELARRVGLIHDTSGLEKLTAELGKVLNGLRKAIRVSQQPNRIREALASYGYSLRT